MKKSVFLIRKMDCPSEEAMVRMRLDHVPEVKQITFDLTERKATILHDEDNGMIEREIHTLNFDSSLLSSETVNTPETFDDAQHQRKLLWTVLVINAALFVVELLFGIVSHSMGLVADSLDMLADALVYGLSLSAVGMSMTRKKTVATVSGYLQLLLALIGLAEVIRRFLGHEAMPDFLSMISVSILALAGNAACLFLLQRARSNEAHIRASLIFTSNDVIINVGVIAAGILVYLTGSAYPDLIIGSIVFVIVCRGALKILQLRK